MNEVLGTILNDTYTLSDLRHRLAVLKTYLTQQFFAPKVKQELAAKDLSWLKSLPPSLFQNFTADNLYNSFSQLEQSIGNFKVLTMYLTFEPDNDTLSQIGMKVRKTFPALSLLDVKYDPNLIAGPALVWRGIYKDYSLRSSIEQKKDMILENFKKYLR